MSQVFSKIAVFGTGKVGQLVAILLAEAGFDVTGCDAKPRDDLSFPVRAVDVTDRAALDQAVRAQHAVVSCLPYHLNLAVAERAHAAGVHYFDLTEDVPTMRAIREMARDAKGVLAPQCGLAPGFIAIVGASLARGFESLRSIRLRVGALPQNPSGLLGYAFIWSPEGVVNEYLNDCEVIRGGHRQEIPSMGGLETTVIDGRPLEAFSTSGGLGTMCETYFGKVDELDYKTLRYPGHCELMRFFFDELYMRRDRKLAGEILVNAKPPVNDDVVYVHAAVEGQQRGHLMRDEFVRAYKPQRIAGKDWRAISWTTAASVSAVVELVAMGRLPPKGFVKQEGIALADFLGTKSGRYYRNQEPAR